MSIDYEAILEEAHQAATKAIREYFNTHNEQPFNCGFAWVTIDGTDGLARHCRKAVKSTSVDARCMRMFYGDKGYPKGWQFWAPGSWPSKEEVGRPVYGQDMDFKAAGCRAFQEVLAKYNIRATVGTRLD